LYKSIYVGIHFYVFELLHIVSDIGYVLTYFRFPRDPYKRKIWLTALGVNWEPPKTATVCSHVTGNDFENWITNRI